MNDTIEQFENTFPIPSGIPLIMIFIGSIAEFFEYDAKKGPPKRTGSFHSSPYDLVKNMSSLGEGVLQG
jgi:hypothetical protein